MDSDLDSEALSDSGDVISELSAEKLDPADRALFEKLKQQELEEREEIERELKEHEEALVLHNNQLQNKGKDTLLVQERGGIRSERELDLSRPNSNKSSSTPSGMTINGNIATNGGGNMINSVFVSNNSDNKFGLSNYNSVPSRSINTCGTGAGYIKSIVDSNGDISKLLSEDFRAHLHSSANFLSSFPLGHPLAHAHLALGGRLLGRDLKGLDGMNPFHPIMASHSAFPSPPSPTDRYPPSSTPHSPTDSLQPSPSPDDPNDENRSHNWTFEEQFKQLYELSDDPKRKDFLDDLFAFMQKRGTPVNRIPIMAKQTLDLYELFRLVVSKGGLVEVINKKLWREITKGLNLPSSITSAAFTLRT
ncbi:unnamed protein product, partial [Candidula unifasciata]